MSGRLREWAPNVMVATSAALLVLLPIEIVTWLLVSGPTEHTTEWLADRWGNPAWRTVDWAFLILAVGHGCLGTAWRLTAPEHISVWRAVAAGVVVAEGVALVVLASYTLLTFELA